DVFLHFITPKWHLPGKSNALLQLIPCGGRFRIHHPDRTRTRELMPPAARVLGLNFLMAHPHLTSSLL
ncbi:MAG: hypothetical protein E6Z15_27020, partial [Paenibacillus macerans]|nr:hypothetical protein [Paenibacillus macerans]